MRQLFAIDNQKCSIYITISSSKTCRFRVCAEDTKPNSKYADRTIEVNGERTIFLSFAVSPKQIILTVEPISELSDKEYDVKIEFRPLKKYAIWIDKDTKNFLKLAVPFCQSCGFKQPGKLGKFFQSEDKNFVLHYMSEIVDYQTGKILNTPARIGHTTGKIEIAAKAFNKYTVPMRLMILLHEFSHKWKNPKMGLPISHEVGADINALYIYLGLGFSKIDAIYVYSNVFLAAQSDENKKRMRKIMDYIAKFELEQKPVYE